ncbi:MAG TPA: type II toxin-antitoxin system HicB family antitoxin [Chthoniobacteraceae bacterium]|nr:type II toxin-antitoxin system HicB family antitoxin [Chthoniobacteraceae bacterium]
MQYDPREYQIHIRCSPVEGDRCYVAQVVEWPGIMAHGDTREAAAREIQIALEGALELAKETGAMTPPLSLVHAESNLKGCQRGSRG